MFKACSFLLFNCCLMSSSRRAHSWPSLPVQRWGSPSPLLAAWSLGLCLAQRRGGTSVSCQGLRLPKLSPPSPERRAGSGSGGYGFSLPASQHQGLSASDLVTFFCSHFEVGVSWRVTGRILLRAGHPREPSGAVRGIPPPGTCLGKGAAGAEPVGPSRPGLGGEKVPESSNVSGLFAREEEAKPWVLSGMAGKVASTMAGR